MKTKEFLIETDILLEHLTTENNKSVSDLEILMQKGICFTTVINAAELLFCAENTQEKNYVINLLTALKVLGIHSRHSLYVNDYKLQVNNYRDALICVISKLNKLPIVTNNKEKYHNSNIEVFSINEI